MLVVFRIFIKKQRESGQRSDSLHSLSDRDIYPVIRTSNFCEAAER